MKTSQTGTTQFYFSTGIYHSNLLPRSTTKTRKEAFLNTLENDIFLISQSDRKGAEWSEQHYLNGYTSYSSLDRLDLMTETFANLRKKIDSHVESYLASLHYECSVKNLVMTQCWVNVMFENTVHTSHIHPHSIISGTMYVRVPSGASPIKFEDPRMGLFMNSPMIKVTAPNSSQRFLTVEPEPGDVVLFESWLRHEVPMMPVPKKDHRKAGKKSTESQPRISISFNYGKK